jgi:hypothetical protein
MNRNHTLLLVNIFGVSGPQFRRWAVHDARAALGDQSRSRLRRIVRFSVGLFGTLRGLGITLVRQRGRPLPARLDGPEASELRRWLGQPES